MGEEASSSSRWDRTETYSPAAMDSAPASRPATPVNSTTDGATPVAPMPITSARLETSPSFMPKTAARKLPASCSRPRAARPRTTSSWMASSATMPSGASWSSA